MKLRLIAIVINLSGFTPFLSPSPPHTKKKKKKTTLKVTRNRKVINIWPLIFFFNVMGKMM